MRFASRVSYGASAIPNTLTPLLLSLLQNSQYVWGNCGEIKMKFNITKDVCGLFSEFSQCTQKGLVEDILLVVGEEIHLYRNLEHLILERIVDFPAAA